MNIEAEIRDLKRRVAELEGSFGFLTGQLRDVHRSVLDFQEQAGERFDEVERKVDGVEQKFDGLEQKFGRLDQKVDELPRALAEVVRAEFDRRDRQA